MGKGKGSGEGKGAEDLEYIGDTNCCESTGNTISSVICCICFLLILGPILIGVGLYFITSSFTDSRTPKIEATNKVIDSWVSTGYKQISSAKDLQVTFSMAPSQFGGVAGECSYKNETIIGTYDLIGESDQIDVVTDDGNDDTPLKKWEQYQLQQQFPPANNSNAYDSDCNLKVTIKQGDKVIGSDSVALSSEQTLTASSLGCKTQITRNGRKYYDYSSCPSRCSSRGGNYNSGSRTCTVFNYVEAICMQIAPSGSSWKLSTSNGGGCFYKSGQLSKELTQSNGEEAVDIIVRSSGDPWLKYMIETSGTGSFGLTAAQKLQIGGALIAIGVLLTCLWAAPCYCLCKVMCGPKQLTQPPQGKLDSMYHGVAQKVNGKYGFPTVAYNQQPTPTPYAAQPDPVKPQYNPGQYSQPPAAASQYQQQPPAYQYQQQQPSAYPDANPYAPQGGAPNNAPAGYPSVGPAGGDYNQPNSQGMYQY